MDYFDIEMILFFLAAVNLLTSIKVNIFFIIWEKNIFFIILGFTRNKCNLEKYCL